MNILLLLTVRLHIFSNGLISLIKYFSIPWVALPIVLTIERTGIERTGPLLMGTKIFLFYFIEVITGRTILLYYG